MLTTLELLLAAAVAASAPAAAHPIQNNDNVQRSGRLDGTVLTVRLTADIGQWRPNGPAGPPVEVAAFGEEGGALSVPGPLIRARAGTTVALTLRNALGSDLRVFGLCAKPGRCEPIPVAAGATREVRFALNAPGTYYYWASSSSQSLTARSRADSQLGGVIVVDPAVRRARRSHHGHLDLRRGEAHRAVRQHVERRRVRDQWCVVAAHAEAPLRRRRDGAMADRQPVVRTARHAPARLPLRRHAAGDGTVDRQLAAG